MNNMIKHAMEEFRIVGWTDEDGNFNDEIQKMICEGVIKLLEVFGDEGHSGSSAPYVINLFTKLASFDPIAPLTGEDSEWMEVTPFVFQNKRDGTVFKQTDIHDGNAYWIDGKVFWRWYEYEGLVMKDYFTNRDSFVPIEFPWVKPESPEYVFVPTDEFPNEVL